MEGAYRYQTLQSVPYLFLHFPQYLKSGAGQCDWLVVTSGYRGWSLGWQSFREMGAEAFPCEGCIDRHGVLRARERSKGTKEQVATLTGAWRLCVDLQHLLGEVGAWWAVAHVLLCSRPTRQGSASPGSLLAPRSFCSSEFCISLWLEAA